MAGPGVLGDNHTLRAYGYDDLGGFVGRPDPAPERPVPAENFVATLAANVDNAKLTDAEFRDFVRRSLPVVRR